MGAKDDFILQQVMMKYPKEYECALLIKEYVKQSNNIPEIYFASDGGFSGKYDLAADRGGVFRNKRYAAIVDSKSRDVSYLGVETERGVHVSGVDALLAKLWKVAQGYDL